jgi:hypothetical protein
MSELNTAPEHQYHQHFTRAAISSTTTKNWMRLIGEERFISFITIPGTHDTMTYNLKYPNDWTQCQSISLTEQLERGIRFIDIRLRYDDSNGLLKACHGIFDCEDYFPDIVQMCKNFLSENPSETILMSIKNESGDWGDHFCDIVYNTVSQDSTHWYYEQTIPKLFKARGKIVLLRRYNKENADHVVPDIGINVSDWPNNTTFRMPNPDHLTDLKYTVQDEYQSYWGANIENKFNKFMKPVLDEAINDSDMERFYINFASGTGLSPPYVVANYTLELLMDYLKNDNVKFGRYGIIPMDFPQKDYNGNIIEALIQSNFVDRPAIGDLYVIHSKINPHYVLDVKGLGHDNGTPVILNQFNRGDNQTWKLDADSRGLYLIARHAPDKVLTNKDNLLHNFNPLVINERNNSSGQFWNLLELTGTGTVQLKLNSNRDMGVDIAYAKIQDGTPICLYSSSTDDLAQLFQLSIVF